MASREGKDSERRDGVMFRYASLSVALRRQLLYVFIAGTAAAIFWALGQPAGFFTILVYSLCIGNLIHPPLSQIRRLISRWRPAYYWPLALLTLMALTPPVYLVSSVVVWWLAPPSPQPLLEWIAQWKFPSLVTLVFGAVILFFDTVKERLEGRNAELQRSVERGAAQLETQQKDLERAREIQQALLPKSVPQLPGFEVATAWRPARAVGGDYFDVFRLGGGRLGICVADVVGKGVAAALLMANVQATVRAFAPGAESPGRLCSRMNAVLCENLAADKFVTFFYAVLDGERRTLRYANAGHPYPLLVSSDSVRRLAEGGAVLGLFPDGQYQDSTVGLRSGDRLLLFTDGITEASAAEGREFGEENIVAVAQAHRASSAAELNRRVLDHATAFCEGRFHDDATLVVIAVNG